MAIHSSTFAWRIPWTEEPGRLQSMGSKSQTQMTEGATFFHIKFRHTRERLRLIIRIDCDYEH